MQHFSQVAQRVCTLVLFIVFVVNSYEQIELLHLHAGGEEVASVQKTVLSWNINSRLEGSANITPWAIGILNLTCS